MAAPAGNEGDMNRFFRRMKKFGKRNADPPPQSRAGGREPGLTEPSTPPDVQSVRAKAQVHGKVTADKWNQ
jgi:hypothetical protein